MMRLPIVFLVLSLAGTRAKGQQPALLRVEFGLHPLRHRLQQPTAPVVRVDSDSVYSESDVEEKPVRDSSPMLVYPRLLREAEIEGEVVIEAIIDTLGRAEPTSLRVVQTANPGFNESAKDNVLDTRFRPGRVHGNAVRVLVRLPIRFRLKSH